MWLSAVLVCTAAVQWKKVRFTQDNWSLVAHRDNLRFIYHKLWDEDIVCYLYFQQQLFKDWSLECFLVFFVSMCMLICMLVCVFVC